MFFQDWWRVTTFPQLASLARKAPMPVSSLSCPCCFAHHSSRTHHTALDRLQEDPTLSSVDPFVIAVSMVATRTVVAHVVFAAETLSVAAVVSDPAFWVHHVWSAHQDRLALQVMPYAAVPLHPSAHQTLSEILPYVANTCHCFPPVPSPDDEIQNRNVHI